MKFEQRLKKSLRARLLKMTNREIISLPDNDWLDESSRKVRELYMGNVARETPHDRNLGRTLNETADEPVEGEVDDSDDKK